jgi:hypothetical protein
MCATGLAHLILRDLIQEQYLMKTINFEAADNPAFSTSCHLSLLSTKHYLLITMATDAMGSVIIWLAGA